MTATEDRTIRLADVRDIPSSDRPETERHSWQPASLIQLAANPPEPPTIGGLLYPGLRTVLSGETESMKTWLALILCKAELDEGLPVGWVDLDAMGPGAMLERLQLLGCDDTQVDQDFLYYQPADVLDPAKQDELTAAIATLGIRLFVIDAFNPILTLHGLDMNSTNDIEKFWTGIADPICRAGAACVVLDHVVKNTETRGKYSIGSERKASGSLVHLGFRLLEPLTKGGRGRSLLTVHKDRPGYLPRPAIGRLVLTSDGNTISYELEADKSHETGGFRPTVLMEKVSRHLEQLTEPKLKREIEEETEGKADYIRKAIAELKDEGYISETKGPRGALLYTSIRPYREQNPDIPFSSSPPRPDLVPTLRSNRARPSSPPLKGTRSIRDRDTGTGRPAPDLVPEYDFPPNYDDPGPDQPEPVDDLAYLQPDGPANGNEP